MAIQPTSKIWMNGELVNWDEAKVHFLTHALHYGSAAFEGIRCYETADGPAVFRLEEHIDRLFDSWKIFGDVMPFSREEIIAAIESLIRVNELRECYIRPLVFLGYGKMGLDPRGCSVEVGIATWAWPTYLGEEAMENGIRAKVSSFARGNVNAIMNDAKLSGNYVNSTLAKREVASIGYEEAIMLAPNGTVAEGSGENLFIVKKGRVYTPPAFLVLEGITRRSVGQIAEDLGYQVDERVFTRDQLYVADEAFLTGTAAEVTPIRELDNRMIGDGRPGEITKKIQSVYLDAVHGRDSRYESWLHRV